MADSLNDIIHSKLATYYPTMGDKASLDDLLLQYSIDSPGFKNPTGTLTFYSATPTESLNDAAYRYWTNFIPGPGR